jgi:uncharacterized repeat protein (TIGR01451 family)
MLSQTSRRNHANRLSRRAFFEQLEVRSLMAVVDLSPAGDQTGTINGAIYADGVLGNAGTGNLDSFVRISSNDPVTEGYNTSHRPLEFDENSSPTFTRNLPLSEIPIVIIGGIAYREFLLDTNESSNLLSLDTVEIYQTNTAGLTGYPFTGTANLIYDMDGIIDNSVLLDGQDPPGSGTANMHLYVPNSLFGNQQYVILYSQFGATASQDDGFEEWAVRDADDLFSISGRKFNDENNDNTDDNEPGLGSWTIFIDANDNGTLDPGEPSTVTAADGTYTLTNLYPGVYIVCEVQQLGWEQTYPVTADGCWEVTIDDADLTDIDFGNFRPVSTIDIEKYVNGVDADSPTGPLLVVGDPVTFTYIVTNTGGNDLTNVVVSDDQGLTPMRDVTDIVGDEDNILEPGEIWSYTAVSVVIAGQYTNIGSVTALSNAGAVADSDPANYFGVLASIDIEKFVNGLDADTPPGPILDVGDIATFTYVVTNTGNVPLNNVVVVDDNGTPLADDFNPTYVSGDIGNDGVLEPGEIWLYTASKTVTLGSFCNIGTVTAATPLQTQVTDSDAACHFGWPGIITPDKGNRSQPFVHLVNPSTGEYLSSFLAYPASYRGGVRVATGDITGDGIPEIITAPGRGMKAIVKVFRYDGVLLEEFLAYSSTFTGGVDLAVGDVNNDGQNDIVTAMSYNGNQVKVFKNPNGASYNFGTTTTVAPHLLAFTPFGTFKGGAAVEVADMGTVINGGTTKSLNTTLDGRPEIIVANEAGMRSTVYVYGFVPGTPFKTTPYRLRTYLPFTSTFRGGLSLDVARVDLDAIPDIIVGAKSLGSSQVQILNGANTGSLGYLVAFSSADTPSYNAPVNVTASDENGDGIAEFILVSQGSDGAFGRIRKFNSLTGALVDEWLESTFDPLAVDHFFGAYFTETLKR